MDWKNSLATVGFIVLCFVGIPLHVDINSQNETAELFETYIRKYNKTYRNDSLEYKRRYSNFQKSLKSIELMNSAKSSDIGAIYGLTKFSDLSPDEFLHNHLLPGLHGWISERNISGINKLHSYKYRNHFANNIHKRAVLPQKVDWRAKGIIGAIRNQKDCGGCWAFSTVETVESMNALKTGTVEALSVQQVIDCARNGNNGCDGGDSCGALAWMVTSKVHLMPDAKYPLKYATGVCPLAKPMVGVEVLDYTCDNFVGDENQLLEVLANHGPVAVAVNAINWQNYVTGVIQYHCPGSPISLNHAVQIVGYDLTAAVPHYIARNSWGPDFGDKGYLYIAIGGNICGVAVEVSAVTV